MNSRTFGVMAALALAVIIMLTVLLDFVTAHATPITISDTYHGSVTSAGAGLGWEPDTWMSVGDKVTLDFETSIVGSDGRGDFAYFNYTLTIQGVYNFTYSSTLHGFSGYLDLDTLDFSDADFDQTAMYEQGVHPDTPAGLEPGFMDIYGSDEWMVGNLLGEITGGAAIDGSLFSSENGSYLWGYSVTPVPEPTTAILFGVGLLGLTSIRRRKT